MIGKICVKKNIISIINRSYRSPATDGILLAPYMKCWFSEERNLGQEVKNDSLKFMELIKRPLKIDIQRIKVYSILNFSNKLLGEKFIFKIYLHKEKCIGCIKCILNCSSQAYKLDENGFPIINKTKCINCYRCIHHCPQKALLLSKRKTPTKTLMMK